MCFLLILMGKANIAIHSEGRVRNVDAIVRFVSII
jgi:hypothetical protein